MGDGSGARRPEFLSSEDIVEGRSIQFATVVDGNENLIGWIQVRH
jgi:hypothetical protein